MFNPLAADRQRFSSMERESFVPTQPRLEPGLSCLLATWISVSSLFPIAFPVPKQACIWTCCARA